MGSDFDTLFDESAAVTLMDLHGEAVTIDGVAGTAIVEPEGSQVIEYRGRTIATQITVHVLRSEFSLATDSLVLWESVEYKVSGEAPGKTAGMTGWIAHAVNTDIDRQEGIVRDF